MTDQQSGRPMTAAELAAERASETLDTHPDPATAELEKCKHLEKLNVNVGPGTGHPPADTLVRYIPTLVCRNPDPAAPAWGALLEPAHKTTGMHLFADAVEGLPDLLDAAADACTRGECVNLQHKVNRVDKTWRQFDVDSARLIANQLRALPPA